MSDATPSPNIATKASVKPVIEAIVKAFIKRCRLTGTVKALTHNPVR
jgi:hypothetical protein